MATIRNRESFEPSVTGGGPNGKGARDVGGRAALAIREFFNADGADGDPDKIPGGGRGLSTRGPGAEPHVVFSSTRGPSDRPAHQRIQSTFAPRPFVPLEPGRSRFGNYAKLENL